MEFEYYPEVCAQLERLIADEADARKNYYTMLDYVGGGLTEKERKIIDEIISEELKHTKLLQEMVSRRSKIFPEEE